MGSILSPILAQYVMDQLLDECIPKLSFQIPFCKKFVDDLILAIPIGTEQEILEVFHTFHSRIRFTIEEEIEDSVPFLDTKLIRQNNILKTDWYIKPMASNRYIHYRSYHQLRMKMNVILNLKFRINKISHPDFLDKNLKRLFDIMLENGYPKQWLKKIIFRTPTVPDPLPSQTEPVASIQNEAAGLTENMKTIVLPRADGLSDRLTKVLRQDNYRFTYIYTNKSKSLFTKLKDITPDTKKSNVVYKITCMNCDLIYIGETKRTLNKRINSHRSDIKRRITSCALAKHSIDNGHNPNFGQVKVIDEERNMLNRRFLELFRINQHSQTMNSRRDLEGISSIYANLLEIDKKTREVVNNDATRLEID